MSYEISNLVYKKLKEIEELNGSDYGEWENHSEELVIQSISNICIELGELISVMQRINKERVGEQK